MRIPKSWNDRTILEDEPLRSAFISREVATSKQRTAQTTKYSNGPVIEKLKAEANWLEVVKAWLGHAFPKDNLSVDYSVLVFFLEFYWCLYTNKNDLDAHSMIDKERVRRGLFHVYAKRSKSSRQPRSIHKKKDTPPIKDEENRNSGIKPKSIAAGRKSSFSSLTTSKATKTTNTTSHVAEKHLIPTVKKTKKEDSELALVPDPPMESEIPSLLRVGSECVRGPTSSAMTKLEDSSHVPKKRRPSTSLDNREVKRHENAELDTSIVKPMKRTESVKTQKNHIVARMPRTQKVLRSSKDHPPSNRQTTPLLSRSGDSAAVNDKKGIHMPEGETNISRTSSNIPKSISVPKIPPLTNLPSSHVAPKSAFAGLHFKKNIKKADSDLTTTPKPATRLEIPSFSTVVSDSGNSPTSIAPTELQNPPNDQKRRASTSLDGREAKRHAISEMDAPIDRSLCTTESVETQKIQTDATMSRPNEMRQNLVQAIIMSSLNNQAFRESTITFVATPKEMPMKETVSVDHPSGEGSVDLSRPKNNRCQSTECTKAEAQSTSTSLVSTAPIIKETRIKQEPADIYPISPSDRSILRVQAYEDEDEDEYKTRALPPEFMCEEKPDWIRPSEDDGEEMFLLAELSGEEANWMESPSPSSHVPVYYRFPRPPLRILPPIWAESRQEICESFDWFRSYQGGVYHAHNFAKGYLLSAFPSSRDRFEHGGRLIISHGGGRAESLHSIKGHISSQPAGDQLAQDKSVRALFDNYFHDRPLALLIDDKYALFPLDLRAKGIAYAVLGFYTIAHAWAEYQPANNESGRVVRYKFAFRWCEEQGTPWWHRNDEELLSTTEIQSPQDTPDNLLSCLNDGCPPGKFRDNCVSERSTLPQGISETGMMEERTILERDCSLCSRVSLRVFDPSWVCLNPDCQNFWRQANGQYLPDHLDYHPDFLKLPPPKPIPVGFGKLEPDSPLSFIPDGNVTNYAFSRGFHCHNCGRLSCRFKWERWECMNIHCEHAITIEYPPRDAKEFSYQTQSTSFKDHSINVVSEIIQLPPTSFIQDCGRGIVHTFLLPHDGAKIHHIQTRNPLGRKEADSIFHDYQIQAAEGDLKFRRWPMRAHKCRGALLTNYFSQNSGEPYKYVGGDANTVPFQSAPEAVVKARALIQKRIKEALGISAEFNEVLSAAYMERQKMAFHSDNEVGLGPLVAGLSLGSPALMHFRLHAKHDPDREKRGILLSVVLRHGDILVMDGSGVQEYYEHTVVPDNFRIAATARQINAGHA